ncbi:MAG: S-layer homology domain-containing protein [Syntrophomonadaceae bacterium]|nr:S-layer homology domain-containing protein [Syntrophomonadaceae bacterium]
MKRTGIIAAVFVIATVCFLLSPCPPVLGFTGYDLGLTDNKEYQEIVFVSGKPTVFRGTVKETTRTRDNTEQTTLTYKLEGLNGSKDKLSRTIKLTTSIEKRNNQEVHVTTLDSLTETINIGGKQYKLVKDSVFFNGSRVVDRQAVIDYLVGNWYIKKSYEVGRGEGRVTVEISGESDGYRNAWGEGETRTVQVSLQGEIVSDDDDSPAVSRWQGSLRAVMNRSLSRTLYYSESSPELISFAGGFVENKREDQTLKIIYDLPTVTDDGIMDGVRNRGEETLAFTSPPEVKRLFVKECKDLRGHWARQAIEALCGLGAFDVQGDYFQPGVAIRRGEFIKAMMVVGEAVDEAEPATTARGKKTPVEEPYFLDVDREHPYFKYIQAAYRKGLVQGNGAVFLPNSNLTRAEAISILVKAMGLENLAPTPYYTTGYYDDAQIPLWAKDAVYVATYYGLIKGDLVGGNRLFRPLDIVTRAEAASLLDQFRIYLNQDFRKDRERVYQFSS